MITYRETNGMRTIVDIGVSYGYIERRKFGSDWLIRNRVGDRRIKQRRKNNNGGGKNETRKV